jgi:hypothetical protein
VLNTVTLLRARGIHVRSISDGIDPAPSTGRLMLNMLATLAEYERELIIERVNAGIAAARQNGTRHGRPVSDPAVIADKLAIAQDAPSRSGPVVSTTFDCCLVASCRHITMAAMRLRTVMKTSPAVGLSATRSTPTSAREPAAATTKTTTKIRRKL